MGKLKDKLARAYGRLTSSLSIRLTPPALVNQEFARLQADVRAANPADLAGQGFKVYSQNDEDGIIEAIFDRIGSGQTFCEIGVENGRECNTHYLALKGWRGSWIDGNPTMCAQIEEDLGGREFAGRFALLERFVDRDNIVALYRQICAFVETKELDFFSLDIDGNDLYVLETLLASGASPAVICVEYNGKFPPPLAISVAYDKHRIWQRNDHFGASLQAFHKILVAKGYGLVTCNITGANAFYVRADLGDRFEIVEPAAVWRRLRLELCPLPASHRPSLGFLRERLRQGRAV